MYCDSCACCCLCCLPTSSAPSKYLALSVDERTDLQYTEYLAISGKINFRTGCTVTPVLAAVCAAYQHLPLHLYILLFQWIRGLSSIYWIPGNIRKDKLPDRMYFDSCTCCCCLCCLPTSSSPSQYLVLSVDERTVLYIYLAISGEINFRIGCTVTPVLALSVLPTNIFPSI